MSPQINNSEFRTSFISEITESDLHNALTPIHRIVFLVKKLVFIISEINWETMEEECKLKSHGETEILGSRLIPPFNGSRRLKPLELVDGFSKLWLKLSSCGYGKLGSKQELSTF